MKVGTGVIDITPDVGGDLCGFGARVQPSTGIHDRLKLRCLYLEDSGEPLLWWHADLIGVPVTFVEEMKRWAGETLGLQPRQVILSATHTHAGPCTVELLECGRYDADYLDHFRGWLKEAARAAMKELREADCVWGRSECTVGVDRRGGKPSAHTDPCVGCVAWRSKSGGDYIAVLASYAVHPVAANHLNRQVSGDLHGAAAALLEKQLPGRPVVLMTNGPAANINPRTMGDCSVIEEQASEMARAVNEALHSPLPLGGGREGGRTTGGARRAPLPASPGGEGEEKPILRTASINVQVPLHPADQAWLDQTLAQWTGRHGNDRGKKMQVRAAEAWHRHMSQRLAQGKIPTHQRVEVQVIGLGPVRWVTLSGEIFSCMGPELRHQLGDPLFVVGYANGLWGYLPSTAAHAEGGYEVDMAWLYFDSLPVLPGGHELVRGTAVRLANSIGKTP